MTLWVVSCEQKLEVAIGTPQALLDAVAPPSVSALEPSQEELANVRDSKKNKKGKGRVSASVVLKKVESARNKEDKDKDDD